MIDYKAHDKSLKLYYDDHLQYAKNLGFDTVSEAIAVLYSIYTSTREVAKLLRYGSKTTIIKHLNRMGIQLIGPGGNNKDCEFRHNWKDGWVCERCGVFRHEWELMKRVQNNH